MGEREFARFEFKMSFGRISYIAQYPRLHAILLLTPLMLDGQIPFQDNHAIFTLRWLLLILKRRTIRTTLYSQNPVVSVNRSLCIKSTFFKYHSLCCLIAGEIYLHHSLSHWCLCVRTVYTYNFSWWKIWHLHTYNRTLATAHVNDIHLKNDTNLLILKLSQYLLWYRSEFGKMFPDW